MITPSPFDGFPDPEGEPIGDVPYLPPARPAMPVPTAALADAPYLPSGAAGSVPSATSASVATAAPPSAPAFDAKAMVESQKHYNTNPAYGPMPAGTDESRAAARKLRETANRKRRRGKTAGRVLALIALVGLGVGGYFVYQAIQDDPPLDGQSDPDAGGAAGEGGALTPLGEQVQVIDALDDLNSGATPGAGALLDAVDDAREAVGQAEPPVAAEALMVADVFTPAVLDHTEVLDPVDGHERFVVRADELASINPSAHTALVDRLRSLPQVAEGDERLVAVPVVLPGDLGIAIERDGDQIVRIAAVASDPPISAAGP